MQVDDRYCIYCLKIDNQSSFNTEHVIQDSMTKGIGIQDNLTLTPEKHKSCVCKNCNDELGRELDQSLSRDSIEAMFRSEYGLLKPKKGKALPVVGNSTRLKIKTADENHISIRHETNERVATVHPHIRILDATTQDYHSFPIEHLSELLAENADLEFEAVNCSSDDLQKINDIANNVGRKITFEEQYQEPDQVQDSQEVQLIANVDSRYCRAIAKIAFNYFAYNTSQIDSSLVLKDDFSSVRDFIRHGKEPDNLIVGTQSDKLLSKNGTNFIEVKRDRILSKDCGHFVEVIMERHGLRRMIIARVCLFNVIPWTVLLTRNYRGIDFPLKYKHFWDLDAKICKQISE